MTSGPIPPRGKIDVDTPFAESIGFTSDKFKEWSYLWYEDGILWISLVGTVRPGNGDFRAMMEKIEGAGFTFRIPSPMGQMIKIGIEQKWNVGSDDRCTFFTNEEAWG